VVGVCGRYASGGDPRDLAGRFGVDAIDPVVVDEATEAGAEPGARPAGALRPDWNVAPTKTVYAVLTRVTRNDPAGRPVRRLRPVRWGLVPSWAPSPRVGASMINARVETVASGPAYRAGPHGRLRAADAGKRAAQRRAGPTGPKAGTVIGRSRAAADRVSSGRSEPAGGSVQVAVI
jgi:hypothetical protein